MADKSDVVTGIGLALMNDDCMKVVTLGSRKFGWVLFIPVENDGGEEVVHDQGWGELDIGFYLGHAFPVWWPRCLVEAETFQPKAEDGGEQLKGKLFGDFSFCSAVATKHVCGCLAARELVETIDQIDGCARGRLTQIQRNGKKGIEMVGDFVALMASQVGSNNTGERWVNDTSTTQPRAPSCMKMDSVQECRQEIVGVLLLVADQGAAVLPDGLE